MSEIASLNVKWWSWALCMAANSWPAGRTRTGRSPRRRARSRGRSGGRRRRSSSGRGACRRRSPPRPCRTLRTASTTSSKAARLTSSSTSAQIGPPLRAFGLSRRREARPGWSGEGVQKFDRAHRRGGLQTARPAPARHRVHLIGVTQRSGGAANARGRRGQARDRAELPPHGDGRGRRPRRIRAGARQGRHHV